ncbi:MAG: hypothetical protein AAF202_05660, partial [Pseudomonadota bacterium]
KEGDFSEAPILTDAKIGKARFDSDPKQFRLLGKSFKYFVNDLVTYQPGDKVHMITDRDITPETGLKLLKLYKKWGFIPKEVPDAVLAEVVFLPMNDLLNRTAYGRKKAAAINQRLFELSNASSATVPRHDVISDRLADAQEGHTFSGHEVRIYENDPAYIDDLIRKVGGELGFFNRIKLIIYHAGRTEEVASSLINRGNDDPANLQRLAVLQPDIGSFRAIIEAERHVLRPLKCTETLNDAARNLED